MDVGALCLSSFESGDSTRRHHTPEKSHCHADKHKAPTRPCIRPLSLLDGGGRCTISLFSYQVYYSVATFVGCGVTVGPIQIVWILTNSRMPKEESSRP